MNHGFSPSDTVEGALADLDEWLSKSASRIRVVARRPWVAESSGPGPKTYVWLMYATMMTLDSIGTSGGAKVSGSVSPAGRVFCSCGHEIQWHSQIDQRCLLQRHDETVCPCTKVDPAEVYIPSLDAAYRLVPSADRGRLINEYATLGMRLGQLRAELPEVEKQARKTPRRDMHDERAKVAAAKARIDPLRQEIAAVEAEQALRRVALVELGAYPS